MTQITIKAAEARELTPLHAFLLKVVIVTVAILIVLYAVNSLVGDFVDGRAEQLKMLQGGPEFWGLVEFKLEKLANAPDLPPEKKKKIVEALRKLSSKYRPYFDAIAEPPK